MRLWIVSDLHIEQSAWDMPDPQPDYDVLIAAGDIHKLSNGVRWLSKRAKGKPVIYIPGNHECYAFPMPFTVREEVAKGQQEASRCGVHLLIDSEVTIDGVRFLGSTLWTDYELMGDAQESMRLASLWMKDHRWIFPEQVMDPLTPQQAREWHRTSLAWLMQALQSKPENVTKTVVVTHHLPHPRSIHSQFDGDTLNASFCSDLSALVESSGAALWVHGHTHCSSDYIAGATRVVCNPKGYGPKKLGGEYENKSFDPRLVVEI